MAAGLPKDPIERTCSIPASYPCGPLARRAAFRVGPDRPVPIRVRPSVQQSAASRSGVEPNRERFDQRRAPPSQKGRAGAP